MDPYLHPDLTCIGLRALIPPGCTHILAISFRRQFPVEVQEQFIDQFRDDVRALRICALTCRMWRKRSQFHLFVRHIRIRDSWQLKELCAYLSAHESLGHLVQSISINKSPPFQDGEPSERYLLASDLISTPLLRRLPNLRRCCLCGASLSPQRMIIHPLTLTYLSSFSSIDTLCLYELKLCRPLSLASLSRLICALQTLRHLVCQFVTFEDGLADSQHAVTNYRRPAQLSSVTVRMLSSCHSARISC